MYMYNVRTRKKLTKCHQTPVSDDNNNNNNFIQSPIIIGNNNNQQQQEQPISKVTTNYVLAQTHGNKRKGTITYTEICE